MSEYIVQFLYYFAYAVMWGWVGLWARELEHYEYWNSHE